MQEFKINEFISLKLENGTTNIYVKGKIFRQCKSLLLLISIDDNLKDANSIDDASENLDFSLDPDTEYDEPEFSEIMDEIKPETEFWAHCSNLQSWDENSYDTRLLHSNIAFPLLKKLSEEGDLIAKRKFKEEIGKRYFTGVESVQRYLEEEGYLKYLDKDELRSFVNKGEEVIGELEEIIGRDILIRSYDTIISPAIIIKSGQIVRLNLSHLNLENLPNCIQKLSSLEVLYFLENPIREIPEWIGKLKALKRLSAVNNKIMKIPDSIGNLKSLEILELSQNEIEKLPESIGNLVSLKELIIFSNRLCVLPKSIGNLKVLRVLLIGDNLLESLPDSIGSCTRMQILKLGINPIRTLPTAICEIPSLKELSVRSTKIANENEILEILRKKKVNIYN